MAYNVETKLTLKDDLTKPLEGLLVIVDKLTTDIEAATKNILLLDRSLVTMGRGSRSVASGLVDLNTAASGTNTRMSNLATRAETASKNLLSVRRSAVEAATSFKDAEVQLSALNRGLLLARGSIGTVRVAGGGHPTAGGGHGGHLGSIHHFDPIGALTDGLITAQFAKEMMHPALELEHAKYQMRTAPDMDERTLQTAMTQAQKTQREVPTTTVAENLTALREIYGGLGAKREKLDEAMDLLTPIAKTKAVIAELSGIMPNLAGKAEGLGRTLTKTVEMTGHLGNSPQEAAETIDKIGRAIVASGGTLSAEQLSGAIKMQKSAKYGKEDTYTFGSYPYLVQEMSNKNGVGQAPTLIRQFNQALSNGIMGKTFAASLQNLNIMPKGAGLDTATTQTLIQEGKIKGGDLISKNPPKWVTDVFLPAVFAKEHVKGNTIQEQYATFDKMSQFDKQKLVSKNYTGATQGMSEALSTMSIQYKMLQQHENAFERTKHVSEEFDTIMNDTAMKLQVTGQEFKSMMSQLQIPTAFAGALDWLNKGLADLNTTLAANNGNLFPETTKAFKDIATAVGALNIQMPGLRKMVALIDDLIAAGSHGFADAASDKKLIADFWKKDEDFAPSTNDYFLAGMNKMNSAHPRRSAIDDFGFTTGMNKMPQNISGNSLPIVNNNVLPQLGAPKPLPIPPPVIVHGDHTVINGHSIADIHKEMDKKHAKKKEDIAKGMTMGVLMHNATQPKTQMGGALNPMIPSN